VVVLELAIEENVEVVPVELVEVLDNKTVTEVVVLVEGDGEGESAGARLLATGVPQPVTGSHPTPAEYPLEPEVTSWNNVE